MKVLRHRSFRLVWSAQVISVVGDGMRTVALFWLAKTQFGTNAAVVAVAAATSIPVVLGSPLGGLAADRFDRRTLMVLADVERGVVSAALAFFIMTDHLTLGWLCALVAIAGCGTALFEPTFGAAIPTLVPPDERASANGLNIANSAGGSLLGPLVGGALLAVVGAGWVLAIDAISFGVSAALVAFARMPRPIPAAALDGDEPKITVRETLRDGIVRRLGGLACVLNFLVAPLTVLLVALAIDRHGAGPRLYGAFAMMVPAGLLAGSFFAPKIAEHRGALMISLVGVGATLSLLGFVPLAVVMGLLVMCGVTIAVANTVLITMLQGQVRPEVLGRAFGILGGLSQALRPAGLLVAAPLLGVAGVGGAFAVIGLGIVAATLLWGRPAQLVP